jgi:hypothetical protein
MAERIGTSTGVRAARVLAALAGTVFVLASGLVVYSLVQQAGAERSTHTTDLRPLVLVVIVSGLITVTTGLMAVASARRYRPGTPCRDDR